MGVLARRKEQGKSNQRERRGRWEQRRERRRVKMT